MMLAVLPIKVRIPALHQSEASVKQRSVELHLAANVGYIAKWTRNRKASSKSRCHDSGPDFGSGDVAVLDLRQDVCSDWSRWATRAFVAQRTKRKGESLGPQAFLAGAGRLGT